MVANGILFRYHFQNTIILLDQKANSDKLNVISKLSVVHTRFIINFEIHSLYTLIFVYHASAPKFNK